MISHKSFNAFFDKNNTRNKLAKNEYFIIDKFLFFLHLYMFVHKIFNCLLFILPFFTVLNVFSKNFSLLEYKTFSNSKQRIIEKHLSKKRIRKKWFCSCFTSSLLFIESLKYFFLEFLLKKKKKRLFKNNLLEKRRR